MKLSKTTFSEKWFYIFPLLVAIYPIIFLYSNNVQELLISQVFVPVAIALIATVIFWASLSFLIKDALKAGIITTIFILFFFFYGLFFDWLVLLNLFTVKHRHILPLVLFVAGYLGYFVYSIKNPELFINGAKILTIIVAVLLLLNIINIVPIEIKKIEYANLKPATSENYPAKNPSLTNSSRDYPDIYYIVLDEYASSSTIKEIYGYDNYEFENHLRDQGFYIANNSKTYKAETLHAIASNLNMEYINKSDTLTLFSKINDNRVMQYLKRIGYTTVVFDGIKVGYVHKGNITADFEFIFDEQIDSEMEKHSRKNAFDNLLIKGTMLKCFPSNSEDYRNLVRNRNLIAFEFEKLQSVNSTPSPKFVYFHITSPHVPFVYDQEGDFIDPQNQQNWQDKKYYLGQYIYTTRQIEYSIDKILSNSKTPPIIIIQSDHGPRNQYMDINMPGKIFNAFYVPNDTKMVLFDNISSVNTFRFIFNQTFHDDIELLAGVD